MVLDFFDTTNRICRKLRAKVGKMVKIRSVHILRGVSQSMYIILH